LANIKLLPIIESKARVKHLQQIARAKTK